MANQTIIGYEFAVTLDGATEWHQLQGSGGAMGAGTLHSQGMTKLGPLCGSLLRQAQNELRRTGFVRLPNERATSYPLRIRSVRAEAVTDCRAILG